MIEEKAEEAMVGAVARQEALPSAGVSAVSALAKEGATVPFMARYRKERTGGLDEEQIRRVLRGLEQQAELMKRKEAVLKSLEERDLLTGELRKSVEKAGTRAEVEDIYRPWRPKRKTRAVKAAEAGLEPLAEWLLQTGGGDPRGEALRYVSEEAGIGSPEEALQGARDILAERMADDPETRRPLREYLAGKGQLEIGKKRGANLEGTPYEHWPHRKEKASAMPAHRFMAVRRGLKEGYLTWKRDGKPGRVDQLMEGRWKAPRPAVREILAETRQDSWGRLLRPSLETEILGELEEKALEEAVEVFRKNLKSLLMEPPFGQKAVIGLDPGYRTGTKAVILDEAGRLRDHGVIFPVPPREKKEEAARFLRDWKARYQPAAVAVGNGTAGREVYDFCRAMDWGDCPPAVVLTDENGASVYSASEAARREFPDYDLTVRGAVSIGRRLQDPLAELVKIPPQSLGVGQYQHDVPEKRLAASLNGVVEDCVNQVGADLNTAGREILARVAGLDQGKADRIAARRAERGLFRNRRELLEIPGLGAKTYEQCAGFLRIRGGDEPLDGTGVHPESYDLARRVARELGRPLGDLMGKPGALEGVDPGRFVDKARGVETVRDILEELQRPGRDPREAWEETGFSDEVREVEDLSEGMVLTGVVTNITAFGAFVDVGVHQDGLVHVSEMADHYVRDPAGVVSLRQKVQVKVISVDLKRRRIALSMKNV